MASPAAAAKPAADAAAAPPKKKSKLILIIALVVVLAGGGAGAWFFLKHKAADADEDAPVAKHSNKPAVFVPIEQFVVNLQPEEGSQFLQTQMTLKVVDQSTADSIKSHMPEVRNRILLLLSSKKPSQINTREGKLKLAEQIATEVDGAIAPPKPAKKAKKAKAKAKKKDAEDEAADEEDTKSSKKAKKKDADEEDEAPETSRVIVDVLFTHFIIQ